MNIGHDEDNIALHADFRFNYFGEYGVVCNSYQGGFWGEEHREGGFPFKKGVPCEVRGTVCIIFNLVLLVCLPLLDLPHSFALF